MSKVFPSYSCNDTTFVDVLASRGVQPPIRRALDEKLRYWSSEIGVQVRQIPNYSTLEARALPPEVYVGTGRQ